MNRVYRVRETTRPTSWVSRPYETIGAAHNRAACLNNEQQRLAKRYQNQGRQVTPQHYIVEVIKGEWEPADG